MIKIKQILMMAMILLVFTTFGCIAAGSQQEQILAPSQGVGVVPGGVYVVDSRVRPGTITSVIVKVRGNLDGQSSENVVVTLDNIAPLSIICGRATEERQSEFMESFPKYSELDYAMCGSYSLDLVGDLRLNQHGVTTLNPGDEVEFIWPIRTPSASLLAGMSYAHTLYYTIDYDYRLVAEESVVYISNQEYLRLQEENATLRYPSTYRQTAGEFRMLPDTKMPILFYPEHGVAQVANVDYRVENRGEGFVPPGEKLVIVVQYPSGLEPDETYKEKIWFKGDELTTTQNENILRNFPDLDRSRILYKELDSEFLRRNFRYPISAPLTMTDDELREMSGRGIPSKTYNLQIYLFYQYRFEKSSRISVYPIEI